MTNLKSSKITRALISVSDKKDLAKLGTFLLEHGVEILSTGGSAKSLSAAGIPVKGVGEHTGFPEIMDGRVKTLHPKIHGGILARRSEPSHITAMDKHAIDPIDMVVVNLYPFGETVGRGADFEACIENIDIGGPTMIRSAAKNYRAVTIVVNPTRYEAVIQELHQHTTVSEAFNYQLACEAFQHTAHYDTIISQYLNQRQSTDTNTMPDT